MLMNRCWAAVCAIVLSAGTASAAEAPEGDWTAVKDMLRSAVAFRTEDGQVPDFAHYLAERLLAAGFAREDIKVTPVGDTATLTVRYRGQPGQAPLLLSAHMDAVTAKREDWTRDPFTLVEENGYFYGRGVADMKADIAVLVQTFIRLKREGFVPKGDMVLVFSGDEETLMESTRALANQFRGARLLLNADAGGGSLDAQGKPLLFTVQTAEKVYADFNISFTAPGGHSSVPDVAGNPIYRLARAVDRIAAYQFPTKASPTTRAAARALASQVPAELGAALRRFADKPDDEAVAREISKDPGLNAQLRTTCVATQLHGGHALNALPQRASVDVNCRIFPGTPVTQVQATLRQIVGDETASIEVLPPAVVEGGESPLRKDVFNVVAQALHAQRPNVGVVPAMSAGATDSMHFRAVGIDSYGVNPIFTRDNDTFAHGLNERVPVEEVRASLEYWQRLIRGLAH